MEKSLKNKIVSIISAVALACCSLLAFVVPSFDDQQQTASAYVGASNDDYRYVGTSVLSSGSSFMNSRPFASVVQCPYVYNSYCYFTTMGNSNNTTGSSLSNPYVFSGTSLVGGISSSITKVYAYGELTGQEWSYTDGSTFSSTLGSISAPANTVYIRSNLQVMGNSPLVYNADRDVFLPRDFFHTGIRFTNRAFSSYTQIGFAFTVDILYGNATSLDYSSPPYKYTCKFYLPLSSIRGGDEATKNIYVPFASVFTNANYGDYAYMSQCFENFVSTLGNKYMGYTIRTAVCTQGSYVLDSLITPDISNLTYTFACNTQMQMVNMQYWSVLSIERVQVVDPQFHYGRAIVDAVNDFTDIEIGNGLSIKLLLIICIGMTIAVAVIKMLI